MSSAAFLKYASILKRSTDRYFDDILADCQIGCGQQFFLIRIYENDGISMYDLARLGSFDKGTVTKAVQKLERLGYVRSERDRRDGRVRRLHATDRAKPVIERIYRARSEWADALTRELTAQEQAQLEQGMEKVVLAACRLLQERGSAERVAAGCGENAGSTAVGCGENEESAATDFGESAERAAGGFGENAERAAAEANTEIRADRREAKWRRQ